MQHPWGSPRSLPPPAQGGPPRSTALRGGTERLAPTQRSCSLPLLPHPPSTSTLQFLKTKIPEHPKYTRTASHISIIMLIDVV